MRTSQRERERDTSQKHEKLREWRDQNILIFIVVEMCANVTMEMPYMHTVSTRRDGKVVHIHSEDFLHIEGQFYPCYTVQYHVFAGSTSILSTA